MRSGKSVLRSIRSRLREADTREAEAARDLGLRRQEVEQARAEESRCVARLAKVRLGAIEGSAAARRLDAADRAALDVLAERDRELERLEQEIATGAAALADLVDRRSERLVTRDERADAYRSQVVATRSRLESDEAWNTQRGHAEFAANQSENAARKATQAEQDRDSKRQPYERDKLFSYLWQRRYRFDEYKAYPLFATLDGWVARLCGYGRAHRDYRLLLEIPERLRAHAGDLAARAGSERDRLLAIEDAALAEDGAVALEERLRAAQAELDAAELAVTEAEAVHDRRCLEQQAMLAGNDPYSARAAGLIRDQLATEDLATLRQDALATPTSADDELVRAIAHVRDRIGELEPRLERAERRLREAQAAVSDLRGLERDFRRRDYESSRSVFDDDFDIGYLLGSMMRGAIGRSDVFRRMRRHQSWKSSGSSFGSFGSGFGSSSGGSFGGFGGGGFSSGGGFGGGGGFSSGGDF
ncbi:MAG: hypothetical protein NXI31_07320 [bacterium]|nr:hypothetical protein [bacterium]